MSAHFGYRPRYAFAFAKAIMHPRRWWLHPFMLWLWLRIGFDCCDGGAPWREYPDDSPEVSAEEEADCWRRDG